MSKPRIYLDSCCFIDVVKKEVGVLPSDRENDVWFIKKILQAHREGHLVAHTSLVAVGECLAVEKGQATVSDEVQDHYRALLTSGQYVQLINPTPSSARLIQRFRWDHGLVLGSADAMHFSGAIERGCLEFITTDGRIASARVGAAIPVLATMGMRVIAAPKTALLPTSYTQGRIEVLE